MASLCIYSLGSKLLYIKCLDLREQELELHRVELIVPKQVFHFLTLRRMKCTKVAFGIT